MMGDGYGYGGVRWNMMGQSGTTGLWILVVVLVLLLVAAVVALAWALRPDRTAAATGPHPAGPGPMADDGSADRILDERLARGEITEDEYRRTRAALHER